MEGMRYSFISFKSKKARLAASNQRTSKIIGLNHRILIKGHCFCLLIFLFLGFGIELCSAQQDSSLLDQWKSHFQRFPMIYNCIVERYTPPMADGAFSGRAETNLYQFRFKDGDFFIRQIPSVEDGDSDHTPWMGIYAGCYSNDCWAIDIGNMLMLFPNGAVLRRQPQNQGIAIFSAERCVYSVLCYGINFIDPASVTWLDDLNFSAISLSGEKYSGKITGMKDGLPSALTWFPVKNPQTQFVIQYSYDSKLDLRYFPSRIELYMKAGNQDVLGGVYRILALDAHSSPLDPSFFQHERYFTTNNSRPGNKALVFTNGVLYTTNAGHLREVQPASEMELLPPRERQKHIRNVKILIFGVMALCAGVFSILIFRTAKKQKTKNK